MAISQGAPTMCVCPRPCAALFPSSQTTLHPLYPLSASLPFPAHFSFAHYLFRLLYLRPHPTRTTVPARPCIHLCTPSLRQGMQGGGQLR